MQYHAGPRRDRVRPSFMSTRSFGARHATALFDALTAADLPPAGPDLLIALDLDGTVLHHDTTMSRRIYQAVRDHIDAGTNVVIATGRGVDGCWLVAEQLDIDAGYLICANGALTMSVEPGTPADPDYPAPLQLVDSRTFDPTPILDRIVAAVPGAILAVEPVRGVRRVTERFPEGELTGPQVVVPLAELGGPDSTRLTVRSPDLTAEELLAAVDHLGINSVEYAVGWTAWLDVSPEGVTKASALEAVREHLGVDTRATVAVGDGANDVEMLRWAGVGVAMGDATHYVKSHADTVTASVEGDGLALVLEYL